jgi:hypothetical protein
MTKKLILIVALASWTTLTSSPAEAGLGALTKVGKATKAAKQASKAAKAAKNTNKATKAARAAKNAKNAGRVTKATKTRNIKPKDGHVYLRTVRDKNGRVIDRYVGKSKSPKADKSRQYAHGTNMRKKYGKNVKVEFKVLGRYRNGKVKGTRQLSMGEEHWKRKFDGKYKRHGGLSNRISPVKNSKYKRAGGKRDLEGVVLKKKKRLK